MAHGLAELRLFRTLVLGVGTSGKQVLEGLQQLWFERFGNLNSSFLLLVNIETEQAGAKPTADAGSMIHQCFIKNVEQFKDIENRLRSSDVPAFVKRYPESQHHWEWITKFVHASSVQGGPGLVGGEMRGTGRLLLHGKNDKGVPNYQVVQGFIEQLVKKHWPSFNQAGFPIEKQIYRDFGLESADWDDKDKPELDQDGLMRSKKNAYFDPLPNIYVVGSLTGGTCSGMAFDLGYLLQEIFGYPVNGAVVGTQTAGIFMIPPVEGDALARSVNLPRVRANAFGALYELRKLYRDFRSPNRMPFGTTYLCAPEYNSTQHDDTIHFDGLIEMVALRVFSLALGYHDRLTSSVKNQLQGGSEPFFGFGIGAAVYPKYSLVLKGTYELLANHYARLTDKDDYRDLGGRQQKILESSIRQRVRAKVDECMDRMFAVVHAAATSANLSLDAAADEWVEKLSKKEVSEQDLVDQFLQPAGQFNDMGKRGQQMLAVVEELIDKDCVKQLEISTNLIYVKQTLIMYDFWFDRMGDLLAAQQANTFVSTGFKEKVAALLSEWRICKGVDKRRYLQLLLALLLEKAAIAHCSEQIDAIRELIKVKVSAVASAISRLGEQIPKLREEENRYDDRLVDDDSYAPVTKMFYVNQDKDYDAMKKGFLGDDEAAEIQWSLLAPVGLGPDILWQHVCTEGTKAAVKETVINDGDTHANRDSLQQRLVNHIRRELIISLNRYLHPKNQQVGFRASAKVCEPHHAAAVAKMFKRVRAGLLKYRATEERGQVARHLLGSEDKGELAKVIVEFGLDQDPYKVGPCELALAGDQIIHTRDIPCLEFERMAAYKQLKDSFLEPPEEALVDRGGESREDMIRNWQAVRLTLNGDAKLNGEVDFTLIDTMKVERLKGLLAFVRSFWFTPNGPADTAVLNVPKAQVGQNGMATSSGCFVRSSDCRRILAFRDDSTKACIELDVDDTTAYQLNVLCRYEPVYAKFMSYISSQIGPHKDQGGLTHLKNLDSFFMTTIADTVPVNDRPKVKESLFGDVQFDKITSADEIHRKDCVVSRAFKILAELRG